VVSLPPFSYLTRHAAGLRAPDYLSGMQALDFRTYLPEDILTKVDRTTMLVSLEARVPLLDHVLLEFLARVPARFKFRRGAGKYLLKKCMAETLPSPILQRAKMGFGVPLTRWFRRELAEYLRDVLLDGRSRNRGLFEQAAVARMLREHQSGARDHTSQLWSLLCFEQWARQWLDR
jgi:asparagine synthase (glutamine-hydrolysing)